MGSYYWAFMEEKSAISTAIEKRAKVQLEKYISDSS